MTEIPKKKRAARKDAPPESFWVAETSRRPCFADPSTQHKDAAEAYFHVLDLETLCPEVCPDPLMGLRRESVCNVTSIIPHIGDFYPRGLDAKIRVASTSQRDALSDLFNQTQKAIEAAYANGLRTGSDLLGQLAAGKITVDQLNKSSTTPEPKNEA